VSNLLIDIDRRRVLRTRREVALCGGVLCLSGVVMSLLGLTAVADIVLTLYAIVFFVHAINYTADLRTLDLFSPIDRDP
jgi:hypothetical protein